MIIGRIPVLEALRAGKRTAHRLYVLESARDIEAIRAAAGGTPLEALSRRELDSRAGGENHQGVILEVSPLPRLQLDEWLEKCTDPEAFLVVLDEIEDPQNFGAITRSAAACGAVAVLFGKDRAAPVSPAAAKAAAGAFEHVDLIQVPNIPRALDQLKAGGFWVAGLAGDAPQVLWEGRLTGRIALVIGNEGRGMRRLVQSKCDLLLRIPMTGAITSLNASVSAGIALAECRRQRWVG